MSQPASDGAGRPAVWGLAEKIPVGQAAQPCQEWEYMHCSPAVGSRQRRGERRLALERCR